MEQLYDTLYYDVLVELDGQLDEQFNDQLDLQLLRQYYTHLEGIFCAQLSINIMEELENE